VNLIATVAADTTMPQLFTNYNFSDMFYRPIIIIVTDITCKFREIVIEILNKIFSKISPSLSLLNICIFSH